MIVVTMSSWLAKLSRKKPIEPNSTASLLERCLGTLDLTLLGLGSMVGSGIYIMTGIAARELAGMLLSVPTRSHFILNLLFLCTNQGSHRS